MFFQVDIAKVNLEVMKTWIAKEIVEIVGYEDEILIDMIYNTISNQEVNRVVLFSHCQNLDPKHLQMTLVPFLNNDASSFTKHLWELMLSAQEDPQGIPQEFIDKKMEELEKLKVLYSTVYFYLLANSS